MRVALRTNVAAAARVLEQTAAKQLPFAVSVALNRVGKTARATQIDAMFSRFTIRRPARTRSSIRMFASSKRDLRVTLSLRDAWFVQHEQGGLRRPGDVQRSIVQGVGARERRRRIVRGSNTPRATLAAGGFIGTTRTGKRAFFRRAGRGRRRRVLAFVLEPQVRLQPRLRFRDTVERVCALQWAIEFERAFAEARQTARV